MDVQYAMSGVAERVDVMAALRDAGYDTQVMNQRMAYPWAVRVRRVPEDEAEKVVAIILEADPKARPVIPPAVFVHD